LRQAALAAAEAAGLQAGQCRPLDFDCAAYLSPEGTFLEDLKAAAEDAGVRLYERDGTVFCYPVLVRAEPEMSAVRIDKKLEYNIRPTVLAAALKKMQAREPRSKPERFIEALLEAYLLLRARKGIDGYIDLPLTEIYKLLVILPGTGKEYTQLDFARDIYFLDISGLSLTRKGYRLSLPASTVSRERASRTITFVTRDGHDKLYSSVRFAAPAKGE